jgi:rRNA maturation protein Nop10
MDEETKAAIYGRHKCDRCGERHRSKKQLIAHERRCGRGDGAFADSDTCPMCGEAYDSYTEHLAEECEPD